jgi:hypothetical protein
MGHYAALLLSMMMWSSTFFNVILPNQWAHRPMFPTKESTILIVKCKCAASSLLCRSVRAVDQGESTPLHEELIYKIAVARKFKRDRKKQTCMRGFQSTRNSTFRNLTSAAEPNFCRERLQGKFRYHERICNIGFLPCEHNLDVVY